MKKIIVLLAVLALASSVWAYDPAITTVSLTIEPYAWITFEGTGPLVVNQVGGYEWNGVTDVAHGEGSRLYSWAANFIPTIAGTLDMGTTPGDWTWSPVSITAGYFGTTAATVNFTNFPISAGHNTWTGTMTLTISE